MRTLWKITGLAALYAWSSASACRRGRVTFSSSLAAVAQPRLPFFVFFTFLLF